MNPIFAAALEIQAFCGAEVHRELTPLLELKEDIESVERLRRLLAKSRG